MTTNNETPASNVNAVDYGKEAATQWTKGATANGRGNANGIIALMIAQERMTFSTEYKVDKDTVATVAFDIVDYFEGRIPRNTKGDKSNKASSAMLTEIMLRVFNIAEHTAAQRSAFDQCGKIVLGLRNKGLCSEDLSLSKGGFLRVPFTIMNDKPSEKASESAVEQYEALAKTNATLDGTKGKSVAELAKRVAPKAEKRAAQSPAAETDKAQSFVAAVKFVSAILMDTNSSDESEFAPNRELETIMFDLKSQLETYFKANPVEKETKSRKAA